MEGNGKKRIVKEHLLKIHFRKLEELENRILDIFEMVGINNLTNYNIYEINTLEERIELEKGAIIKLQKELKELGE